MSSLRNLTARLRETLYSSLSSRIVSSGEGLTGWEESGVERADKDRTDKKTSAERDSGMGGKAQRGARGNSRENNRGARTKR
eukprot:768695-Hanusia_phi.AAC.11